MFLLIIKIFLLCFKYMSSLASFVSLLLPSFYIFALLLYFALVHTYVRTQSQNCICTHIHLDSCVYSFDKWPLDTIWTRRTRTFLFVAQFWGIDISSVLVTSNCMVVNAYQGFAAKESNEKKRRKECGMHCLSSNIIALIFLSNLLTYSILSIFWYSLLHNATYKLFLKYDLSQIF